MARLSSKNECFLDRAGKRDKHPPRKGSIRKWMKDLRKSWPGTRALSFSGREIAVYEMDKNFQPKTSRLECWPGKDVQRASWDTWSCRPNWIESEWMTLTQAYLLSFELFYWREKKWIYPEDVWRSLPETILVLPLTRHSSPPWVLSSSLTSDANDVPLLDRRG